MLFKFLNLIGKDQDLYCCFKNFIFLFFSMRKINKYEKTYHLEVGDNHRIPIKNIYFTKVIAIIKLIITLINIIRFTDHMNMDPNRRLFSPLIKVIRK